MQGAVRGNSGRGEATQAETTEPSLSRRSKTRDIKNQKQSVMHTAKSKIPMQRTGQDFLDRNHSLVEPRKTGCNIINKKEQDKARETSCKETRQGLVSPCKEAGLGSKCKQRLLKG